MNNPHNPQEQEEEGKQPEISAKNFDISQPIDTSPTVVFGIGGERQFYKMIEMLEDAVNKTLTEIIKPIDERDWYNIK
jgi:hypothetical protein|tara:strand:- start:504 stop:737 length:234 start_codon:yes stop_codon:yes gene_type:complete